MKQTLKDYGLTYDHILRKCDNSNAISFSKNLIQHSRTKHIEVRHHFLMDHIVKRDIVLVFAGPKHN